MQYSLPSLPLGMSSFSDIRENHYLYVDKTDLIYNLITRKRFCLLTRPRRFGKSLLLSTIDCLFREGTAQFEGLKIEKLWHEPACRTIYLDLSGFDFQTLDEFRTALVRQIRLSARSNAMPSDVFSSTNPVENLDIFVEQALPSKVVILVDEYDAPVRSIEDEELKRQVTEYLKTFFTAIKRLSRFCRFILLTGITRNILTDEYSCLNFLADISLQAEYGSLLGYTDKDLDDYFTPYIRNIQAMYHLSEPEVRNKIRYYYDGYSFERRGKIKVYNNWSVLGLFDDDVFSFSNYWYESGTVSKELRDFFLQLSLTEDGPVFSKLLATFREGFTVLSGSLNMAPHATASPVALLFFLGYLTIEDAFDFKNPQRINLTLPNYEIESSLARLFYEVVYRPPEETDLRFFDNWNSIIHQYSELGLLASLLESIFNTYSYDSNIYAKEALLRDALFVICKLKMLNVAREAPNAKGRSDLEIETREERLVFEFKVAKTQADTHRLLNKAVTQIANRAYGSNLPPKTVIRYAVVISAVAKKVSAIRVTKSDGTLLGEWSLAL